VFADPTRIGNVLARLGELGIGLSRDDFGPGCSSLTHLRSLPVGEIKIDRSFTVRIARDPVAAAIVHATLDLAQRLGIDVVAEGVEDEETWRALRRAGCPADPGIRAQPAGSGGAHRGAAARPHPTPRRELLLPR